MELAPIFAKGLQTFCFEYNWRWSDGHVTQQSTQVEAYGLEAAKMLFAYRVVPPHEVAEQVLIEITTPALAA